MRIDIETFEDAVDYLIDEIGAEYGKALALSNKILEDPQAYSGPQAAIAAIRLANFRYKIGQAAQYWKNKSVGGTNRVDKLKKDALMASYDGLVEVINTLKLVARHEHEQSQVR
jgi:hypothetical protein